MGGTPDCIQIVSIIRGSVTLRVIAKEYVRDLLDLLIASTNESKVCKTAPSVLLKHHSKLTKLVLLFPGLLQYLSTLLVKLGYPRLDKLGVDVILEQDAQADHFGVAVD